MEDSGEDRLVESARQRTQVEAELVWGLRAAAARPRPREAGRSHLRVVAAPLTTSDAETDRCGRTLRELLTAGGAQHGVQEGQVLAGLDGSIADSYAEDFHGPREHGRAGLGR